MEEEDGWISAAIVMSGHWEDACAEVLILNEWLSDYKDTEGNNLYSGVI